LRQTFFVAYRPAGTREALPGTMRGTCVLRFDRKGTACRAPTKKIFERAKFDGTRSKLLRL
jgi:hypothetical protein